jgi:predicted acyl esterase
MLNYTTAPFAHAETLGGPISASIYATANTTDTEWVVEVEDVSPDGQSRPLTEGALLGSLRAVDATQSWTAPGGQYLLPYHPYTQASSKPVTPGALTRYDVEIFPTLSTIAAGDRIRVTITTADSPHLETTVPETADLVGGVYQVYRDTAGPSSIELPLGTVNQSVTGHGAATPTTGTRANDTRTPTSTSSTTTTTSTTTPSQPAVPRPTPSPLPLLPLLLNGPPPPEL